jgi:DNA-directed RNA polymerase subunit RPC12/RpoP
MPCPDCGELVYVRVDDVSGTASIRCEECDVSSFAKKGTAAHAKWMKACAPTTAPEPKPAPAHTGFALGNL